MQMWIERQPYVADAELLLLHTVMRSKNGRAVDLLDQEEGWMYLQRYTTCWSEAELDGDNLSDDIACECFVEGRGGEGSGSSSEDSLATRSKLIDGSAGQVIQ